MKITRLMIMGVLLSAICAGQANPVPRHVLQPTGQVLQMPDMQDGKHMGIPFWSGEYLIQMPIYTHEASDVSLYIWDSQGHMVAEPHIWFDGSIEMCLTSVQVTSPKSLLVAGYAKKSDGTDAFFIAESDLAGRLGRVVQVSPYIVRHVCMASDGTVWAFGNRRSSHSYLLRHFDLDKGYLEGFLTSAAFAGDPNHWPAGSVSGQYPVFLTCGADRVQILSGHTQEWIELDTKTKAITRYTMKPVPEFPDAVPFNLAQLDSGGVFASIWRRHTNAHDALTLGIFELQTNEKDKTATWVLLKTTDGSVPSSLLGTNGQELIYRSENQQGLSRSRPIPVGN